MVSNTDSLAAYLERSRQVSDKYALIRGANANLKRHLLKRFLREIRHKLTINPTDRAALFLGGNVEVWRGNLSAALAKYEKLLRLERSDAEVQERIANTLWLMNRDREALSWAHRALSLAKFTKSSTEVLVSCFDTLSTALFSVGKRREAERVLIEGFSETNSEMLSISLKSERKARAQACRGFRILIERTHRKFVMFRGEPARLARPDLDIYSEDTTSWFEGLLSNCPLDASRRRVDGMLAKERTFSDALILRAAIALELGKVQAGKQYLARAEEINPGDPGSAFLLGKYYYGRRDFGRAIHWLRRALRVSRFARPSRFPPAIYSRLASALLCVNRKSACLEILREGIRRTGENVLREQYARSLA